MKFAVYKVLVGIYSELFGTTFLQMTSETLGITGLGNLCRQTWVYAILR